MPIENLVEFPGFGLQFDISRVAFTVFGIPIYWYGICIGVGMLLAVLFAFSQCNRFGIDGDRMVDVILIGFVLGIIGGRLYFVIFSGGQYNTLVDIINLRAGGVAIYGGIIGGFIGAALGCFWRKVPPLPMMDLVGLSFLIGQAIGRWGNFFNQEAFGSNTELPWGMFSQGTRNYLSAMQGTLAASGVQVDPNLPVHPTFLYESLWCTLGFVLLYLYSKRRKFNGEIFLMYVMWYGLGRFFIEGLRTDSLMTLGGSGLRVSQAFATLSVVAAFVVWVVARVKTAGKPLVVPEIPPHFAEVAIQTESGEQKVVVEWPANTKAPRKAEQEQMAKAQWDAEHGANATGREKPGKGEKDIALGDGGESNASSDEEKTANDAATPSASKDEPKNPEA